MGEFESLGIVVTCISDSNSAVYQFIFKFRDEMFFLSILNYLSWDLDVILGSRNQPMVPDLSGKGACYPWNQGDLESGDLVFGDECPKVSLVVGCHWKLHPLEESTCRTTQISMQELHKRLRRNGSTVRTLEFQSGCNKLTLLQPDIIYSKQLKWR